MRVKSKKIVPIKSMGEMCVHIQFESDSYVVFFPFLFSRVTLVRRTLPGVFSFEYELPTPYNATVTPQSLDLENELPSVLQFEIGPSDIGGTLAVELQLDHNKVSWITYPFNYFPDESSDCNRGKTLGNRKLAQKRAKRASAAGLA